MKRPSSHQRETEMIEIAGEIRSSGPKAVLFFDGDREVWLPRSQIQGADEPVVKSLWMPEWLAKSKGLI